MVLYLLGALVLAAIMIGSIMYVPELSPTLRRWLIVAVSVLVVLPAVVALLVTIF